MDSIRGFSLAAVVLLSLVLPLTTSLWTATAGGRRSSLLTVWIGQSVGVLAGLWIIVSPIHPEWGVMAAVAGCLACLIVLWRQKQPASPSRA